MNSPHLAKTDPLKRQPEAGEMGDLLSPMAPPEAYAPPAMDRVSPEDMHPFLRKFTEEHIGFMGELKSFEDAVLAIQKSGFTRELDKQLRHFFHFFEGDFTAHSRREEAKLFPLLSERLLQIGEHGKGDSPTTATDLMENDHLKAIQLAAVIVNFLGLVFRLPDDNSKLIVLDAALEESKNLIELIRLHIFREDNVVFSSAHRLITKAEFDLMEKSRLVSQ